MNSFRPRLHTSDAETEERFPSSSQAVGSVRSVGQQSTPSPTIGGSFHPKVAQSLCSAATGNRGQRRASGCGCLEGTSGRSNRTRTASSCWLGRGQRVATSDICAECLIVTRFNFMEICDGLKGAASRFDKLGKGHPDYPRVPARLGPAPSATLQTLRARCRADVPHSRRQCKTTRRHGTRGPGRRAGRLSGLRPPW